MIPIANEQADVDSIGIKLRACLDRESFVPWNGKANNRSILILFLNQNAFLIASKHDPSKS